MTDNENRTRLRAAAPPRDDQPLRQRVIARWEDEGGATRDGPQEAVAAQPPNDADAIPPEASGSTPGLERDVGKTAPPE
jgi:hypothetical protein